MKNFVVLLFLLSLFGSSLALGSPKANANVQSLVKAANSDYQRGLYESAARQFAQAFELSGDANYLYDAAISFQQVQRWDECIGYLGRYLELAPISPKRDRARNAQENCRVRLSQSQKLKIETTPPGASVRLGNRKSPILGTTPVELELAPGVQRVFIDKAGFESVIRDVELQNGTPLRLAVQLREIQSNGYLFVDSELVGATVFLNGKSVRLTPFDKPIPLKTGVYQVHLNRAGYRAWTQQIKINALTVHHVPVTFESIDGTTSWRSSLGWVSQVLGIISIGGGMVATHFANQEYNDTDKFRELVEIEKFSYGVGSGLISLGLGLVIWDWLRDPIHPRDRNPAFGQPFNLPADAVNTQKFEGAP